MKMFFGSCFSCWTISSIFIFASSGSCGLTELEVALVLVQHDFEDELAVGPVDRVGLGIDRVRLGSRRPRPLIALAAAEFAAAADSAAAWAFVSTSLIRPSFWRVRSCVSSTDLPSESTLVLTSPTLVLTNFFDAQAVLPTARTVMAVAMKNFANHNRTS